MMARFFAICLAIMPITVAADIIPVQVAEEGDLTRVVLTIPEAAEWDVDATSDRIRITIPDVEGYSTSRAADIIDTSKVSDLSGGLMPEELIIGMTCDCAVRAYLVSARFLTLDISARIPFSESIALPNAAAALRMPWHQAVVPPPNPMVETVAVETGDTSDTLDSNTTPDVLDTAISSGLARATYQGFLELRNEEGQPIRPDASPEILANLAIGIEATLQTLEPDTAASLGGAVFDCVFVSERLQEIWKFDKSFSLQHGKYRDAIATADEEKIPDAMLDYAGFLMGYGLGYEAADILENAADTSDLAAALLYMARVIDDPAPPASIGLETCSEDLAFWSFLQSAGAQEMTAEPRKLIMTFKLLPKMLQHRVVTQFGDALARAGHHAFRAELQEFANTTLAFAYLGSDSPAPTINFEAPASPRDILRADLTQSDLDPDVDTPFSPTSLPLPVLDTLRVERRDTPAEAALLDEVLSRQVADGNYFAVVQLLIDSANSIAPDVLTTLSKKHLSQAVVQMSDPEILAFAFRGELPALTEQTKEAVRERLDNIKVRAPAAFLSDDDPDTLEELTSPEVAEIVAPDLPAATRAPQDATPTFAEAEQLLEGSAAMRNAIETIINDTN